MRNWLFAILTGLVFSSMANAANVDIKANGFGSFYYGQAYSPDTTPPDFVAPAGSGVNTLADFTHFSLLGFDIGAKLNDQWSVSTEWAATGAYVSSAAANYDVFAQWAYVQYSPMDNTSFRFGRQRAPLLMASEWVNNHSSMPYRSIPALVLHNAPISSFDGLYARQVYDAGFAKLGVTLFGGNTLNEDPYTTAWYGTLANGNSLYGARLLLDGDYWRAYGQASTFNLVNGTNLANVQDYSVGYSFDRANWVSWGEFLYVTSPNGTQLTRGSYMNNSQSGYVLLGYRLGDLMPRFTYAQSNQGLGVAFGLVSSYNLGFNYKVNDNVTAKVEYEYDSFPNALQTTMVNQTAKASSTSTSSAYAGVDLNF